MAGTGFLQIDTPRGSIVQVRTKAGTVAARLKWSGDFGQRRTRQFMSAQVAVDSEVLRYNAAYVPFVTGMLEKSGRLGTLLGTGEVRYSAPYAKPQYYKTMPWRSYDAQRGGKWFERMKLRHKTAILRAAQAKAGAK